MLDPLTSSDGLLAWGWTACSSLQYSYYTLITCAYSSVSGENRTPEWGKTVFLYSYQNVSLDNLDSLQSPKYLFIFICQYFPRRDVKRHFLSQFCCSKFLVEGVVDLWSYFKCMKCPESCIHLEVRQELVRSDLNIGKGILIMRNRGNTSVLKQSWHFRRLIGDPTW